MAGVHDGVARPAVKEHVDLGHDVRFLTYDRREPVVHRDDPRRPQKVDHLVELDALDDTELTAFFLGYSDGRDPTDVVGLFGDIEIYTVGGSWIGVYPLGPGKFDVILWGALQFGSYTDSTSSGVRDLDHVAGALLAEFGYQPTEVWAKPWLRAGVNFASGDSDSDDGSHNTFFNLLPTNHLYYGYADQLAFQNLVDLFLQLKLTPLPKVGIEIAFHQFWLHERKDLRYFGTGAFTRSALGLGGSSSSGSNRPRGDSFTGEPASE
ncbi:MAG: alginate export family protein [Proteobacteria bacterium]|nr:alginate export family protein [Pseudomonadota bacterium]